MFFESWYGLFRVITVACLAYFALVLVLRSSGKRTLSKMNAFDLVVTVALGSTLATVILSKDVALLEGIVAFVTLALLQFVVSWLSVRFPSFEGIVKSEPTLLVHRGAFLSDNMRRMRITRSEILSALRINGTGTTEVDAVVLETDGTMSVIQSGKGEHSLDSLGTMAPERSKL